MIAKEAKTSADDMTVGFIIGDALIMIYVARNVISGIHM